MYSFLIRLLLVLELLSPLSCTHVHNDSCGYDPVQQTQCTHEHTPDCFEQFSLLNYLILIEEKDNSCSKKLLIFSITFFKL